MGIVWVGGEVLGAFRDFRCVVVMAFRVKVKVKVLEWALGILKSAEVLSGSEVYI